MTKMITTDKLILINVNNIHIYINNVKCILPSDIQRVSTVVIVHAIQVTNAQVSHRHGKHTFLHHSWCEYPHQYQAQGTLDDKMHYLSTTVNPSLTYYDFQIIEINTH